MVAVWSLWRRKSGPRINEVSSEEEVNKPKSKNQSLLLLVLLRTTFMNLYAREPAVSKDQNLEVRGEDFPRKKVFLETKF